VSAPRFRVTRTTLIRDVISPLRADLASVKPDDNLTKVVEAVISAPTQRVLPVVDEDEKLVGLIRLSTICGEALDRLAPELLMADIDTLDDVFEFAQLEAARTATQLMEPGVSINQDARLVDALRLLHDPVVNLTALPVVDNDGHLLAVIDVVQLLGMWMDQVIENPTDET
jgi:CBS domain-containing protein